MRKHSGLIMVVLVACIISQGGRTQEQAGHEPENSSSNAEFLAVTSVVREFFEAFDERDLVKLETLLTPATQIIDHNGVASDSRAFLNFIKDAENWWPRERSLWDFQFTSNGTLAVVGLKNQVNFSLPNNEKRETLYNETWILEKIGMAWKPIRIHYSEITQVDHSN